MKVMIGYDGSESGEAIFADLKLSGLPRAGEARVVSVADLFVQTPDEPTSALPSFSSRRTEIVLGLTESHTRSVIEETRQFIARAGERLRLALPDWTVTEEVRLGTPAGEIIEAASEFDADLIVVGSQGRSAIGRLILGSVSKRIATDAQCSVRVARPSGASHSNDVPRVIVGIDGSPASEEAVYAVGHRVWQVGTEVRLVSVDDGVGPNRIAGRLPQAAEMIDSYLKKRESRVTSMIDWGIKELSNIGLNTSVLSEKGDAQTILMDEARRWSANCIFVGTRDFSSAFERFRLGSVSTAVVTDAHCSVEIVRPEREALHKALQGGF